MKAEHTGKLRRKAAPGGRRYFAFLVAVVAWCSAVSVPAEATAEGVELHTGATAGVNWNLLTQPDDPAGGYTFLWGSAFTGFGSISGLTLTADIARFDDAVLQASVDALYGYHRAAGYADHGDAGRIDVLLHTHVLRLPMLARLRADSDNMEPTLGVGIEPILGLASSSNVEQRGFEQPVQQVHTTAVTTLAGVAALGLEFDLDDGRTALLDTRLAYNPFVGSTTEERFENFESPQRPGYYRVAFDWQLMVTLGVRWGRG